MFVSARLGGKEESMARLPLIDDDQDLLPVLRHAGDDMLMPLVG